MKKFTRHFLLLSGLVLIFGFSRASDDWPKVITTDNGTQIKVYQPEPESFKAVSYTHLTLPTNREV